MMRFPFLWRLTLLALLAFLCPAWARAEISLKLKSEPGDYIGAGKTYSFPETAGTFSVQKNYANGVSVSFVTPGYGQYWSLDFAAPGRVLLQRGAYPGATRFPFNDTGEPGLNVSGNSRGSNQLTGGFVVKDIAFGANDTIERFWAIFEQHSEGAPAALTGEIRYNVKVVTQVFAPIGQVVTFDRDLDLAVTAADSGGRAVTLTAANLPLGATFTDHGNRTGTLHWRPSLVQSGASYTVTFAADNGAGGTDSTQTVIEVRGITRLTMTSGPDDPVGGGLNYDFGPGDGSFSATLPDYPRDEGGISIYFNKLNYAGSWSLTLVPPAGETLGAGVYTGSGWKPARIDVGSTYSYANQKFGNFQLKELAIEGRKVRKFWATFEQYTAGATTPLRGEIRFNVSTTFDLAAPVSAAVAAGGAVEVNVSAAGGAGGSFTLSATDLPTGAIFTDHGNNTGTLRWPTTAGDIGVHRVNFRAEDADGQVRAAATEIEVKGVTSLAIRQAPYGGVVPGQSRDFSDAAGVFRLTKNAGDGISATFSPHDGDSTQTWFLEFAAPGKTKLTPGFYRGATAELPSDSAPTLLVRHQSQYPSRVVGIFEVKEIAYGPDDTLTRFRATFEQDASSEGRVQGEFRFNATNVATISAPLQQAATFGAAIDFDVTASDPVGGTAVLSAMNLPVGAVFTDRGDGTGHFHWATSVGDRGSRKVIFKVQTSTGATDTATTAIDVTGVMALTLNSQPGDSVGQGKDYHLGSNEGRFTARKNEDNGVSISFDASDPSQSWTLAFAAPGNVPLAAGAYPGATRYYVQNLTAPALLVAPSPYAYFNTSSGSFVIKEIVVRADGTIESFWATFEQYADGSRAALAGEIRFNVAAPVQLSVPKLATVQYGNVRDFTVSALSISGSRVTLSVDQLPPGATFTDHGDGTGTLHWQPGFAQIGEYAILFTATNAAGQTDAATIRIEVSGITSLTLKSDPGDYVGDGKTYDYPATAGRFTAWPTGSDGVTVNFANGTDYWYLTFQAGTGQTLSPGTYTDAGPYNSGNRPGIYVWGNGRSPSGVTGAFRIKQLVYGPGNAIVSFWAVFEQHAADADAALVGEIKFNATAAAGIAITAPFQARVRYGETIEFEVAASDPAGGAIGLSVSDPPPNSEFTDHGDGTGTFRWTPGLGDRGTRTMTFTARNAVGAVDSTAASVKVLGLTSLAMESEPGDWVGAGKSYYFPADAGSFAVQTNYDHGVSVSFVTPGYKDYWDLNFAAPGDARLQPGIYSGATRFPFQAASAPGLDVYGNSRGSNMLNGNFTVKQIEYNADGTIESFWVLFEQHSEGAAPALTGEFKYNAWPSGQVSAPFARSVARGQTLEFAVSASVPDGTALALSAEGLPPGAEFTDHHDNTGTFRWPTGVAPVGRYDVTFGAADAHGPVVSARTVINVRGVTTLAMRSEPGEFIGRGESYFFPETAGNFSAYVNYAEGVSITFAGKDSANSWSLDFAAPGGVPLQPGIYPRVFRFPYHQGFESGLDVRNEERRLNVVTGGFTVKQIVYGPDHTVAQFWATFERRSGDGTPALFGEIKFNADAPNAPEIPEGPLLVWSEVNGSFRGVMGSVSSPLFAASGPVMLTISSTGVITGKVRFGGRTYFFRGALTPGGGATVTARSPDGRTVTVALQVTGSGDRFRVAGEVTLADGSSSSFIAGRPMPAHTGDATAGNYTFLLRPTSDDLVAEGGWGSLVVGKTGALRMIVTTADGRNFATTARPNEDGSWPIFFETFFLRGSVSGLLTAEDLAASDINGALRWFRPPTAQGPYHSAANAELILEASRYIPASPVLQLPSGYARLSATGNRSTGLDEFVALDDHTSRVAVFGENASRMLFYANGRTGQIRGTFRNAAKRVTTLRGIIYQKTNRGQGTFSDGIELGSFTLVPE